MQCKSVAVYFAVISCILFYSLTKLFELPNLPKLDENEWWGHGDPEKHNTDIREFKITISKKELDNLNWRLNHVRPLTPSLKGLHHHFGLNSNLLQEVLDFWRTEYNWTEREIYFNQLPQYMTNIQGLDIHFIHIKPKQHVKKAILPLLIVHGFPSSLKELYTVFDNLQKLQKNENFDLEIIAPHIPGYGFSEGATKSGLAAPQIAIIFKKLMERLGFHKFYAQGGDIGSTICQILAIYYPTSVLGFHSSMPMVYTPGSYVKPIIYYFCPSWMVRPDHKGRVYPIWEKAYFLFEETGYFHIQVTKPDTIGVAMSDSPVGLAAYILEKFITGANFTWRYSKDGHLKEAFSYTDLLDNIMIYWWTGSATTSFRFYAESFSWDFFKILRHPVPVPTAIARFEFDLYTPDGVLNEIYPNLIQLSDYEGGHFGAFQKPDLFANDVIKALRKFEHIRGKNKGI